MATSEARASNYASVDPDGVVLLGRDHPGFADPVYRARRNQLAALSAGWTPGQPVPRPVYAPEEDRIWATVVRKLTPLFDRYAARCIRDAVGLVGLPTDRVPQLDEVSAALRPLTGFSYGVVSGLAELRSFYGHLADGIFLSTQYLRHPSTPLYTPEPDIIHEVLGHGLSLGVPSLAELCRAMGRAVRRVENRAALEALSRIFWFSVEFGCVWEDAELRTYGAGILSSFGEIQAFRAADIRALDLRAMANQDYDVTHFQPVLFAGRGMAQIVDVVGEFFDRADDDRLLALRGGGGPSIGSRPNGVSR